VSKCVVIVLVLVVVLEKMLLRPIIEMNPDASPEGRLCHLEHGGRLPDLLEDEDDDEYEDD